MSNAPHFGNHPMFQGFGRPVRQEVDLRDCEVEGQLPTDLEGSFYRVGPDYQYPPRLPNIPFDGEGHLCLFRFSGGRVDFRSRYVQTERYTAQAAAGRALFGTYRNPFTDDASVAGLSRGTANTNVFHHHGKLMALKEDSPPVVLDPHTLETLEPVYRFGGQLTAETFTAHPKLDSETGEMLGIAYEAKGLGSRDVACYSFDTQGRKTWEAWVKVPYAGMLHDFAVTRSYIAFLVVPMVTDIERMRAGQVHFAWDSTLPTWLGVLRRGGDGSDIRWFKGPERCATHVMGAFEHGTRLSIDMDMGLKNQFPFFPQRDDSPFDPVAAQGHVVRLSVDLADKLRPGYDMDTLYPHSGVLSRQDDPISNQIVAQKEQMVCRKCKNEEVSTFQFNPKEGCMICQKCGLVVVDNVMDKGEEKRNFEGVDKNHHAPAPDMFAPDYANTAVTMDVLNNMDYKNKSHAEQLNRVNTDVNKLAPGFTFKCKYERGNLA